MKKHSRILRFDRFVVERAIYSPGGYMPPHTDTLSRISIILDGEMKETCGSEDIDATPGSLVIKPNTAIHENVFGQKPVKILTIGFEDDEIFKRYFTQWQFIRHPKVYIQGLCLWKELVNMKDEDDLAHSLHLFSSVTLLNQNMPDNPVAWVEQLRDLLSKDLPDAEKICELSQKLSLHRVYMSRTFKKKYGVSPVEFRKYTRVAAAFADLSISVKSLAAIAFDAGFSDQSHMNREFKQYTGCSPAAFRQLISGN